MNCCLWNTKRRRNKFQVAVRAEASLITRRATHQIKCFTLASICCTEAYTLRVCLLWSVSTMLRDAGCYRVHAEQNKQHQNCTLRILCAQQHRAWRKTLLFIVVAFSKSKLGEHTDGNNNITAQWTPLHVLCIFVLVWLCGWWIPLYVCLIRRFPQSIQIWSLFFFFYASYASSHSAQELQYSINSILICYRNSTWQLSVQTEDVGHWTLHSDSEVFI